MGRSAHFLCVAVAPVLFALPVWGATINLLIDPAFGSTENTGATGVVRLEFSEQGPNDYLTVIMENTTPGTVGSMLTAVGFELPGALSLSPSYA